MSIPAYPSQTVEAAHRADRLFTPLSPLSLAGTLVIACAALFVYWPSFTGPFILDDGLYLTESRLIKASDGLYRFWFTTEALDYYPVSNTSLWIEWRLWGTNAAGYRITNLDAHIVTSLLVWLILHKLSVPGAFLAGLLFAVHPLNVESVAWISQRKDMRALLFALLSILLYLHHDDLNRRSDAQQSHAPAKLGRWYWLSFIAFAMAMLSKGSVATTPFVILLIVWWLHERVTMRDLQHILPFIFIAALLGTVNAWYQIHGGPTPHASIARRLAGAGGTVWFYLSKSLLPISLLFHYPQWRIQTGDVRWWLPLLAAIGVTAALICQCRSRKASWARPLLFAWSFYCIALGPVMGFAESGAMGTALVWNHYLHFAIVGVVALVAALWSYWHRHALQAVRWGATVLAVVGTSILALLACQQSWLFGHPIDLYQVTLAANHDILAGTFLHHNIAALLSQEGKLQEAIDEDQKSLTLMPENTLSRVELGDLFLQTGRTQDAIDQYEQALQYEPTLAYAQHNLGNALHKIGRATEAIEHYKQALELNPSFADAHFNYALALADLKRQDESIEQFQEGLQFDPENAQAHYALGNVLRSAGRAQEAIEEYQQALNLRPDYSDAEASLRAINSGDAGVGQAPQSREESAPAVPGSAAAIYNLAVAQLNSQKPQQAKENFQRVLQSDPDNAAAHKGLGAALIMLGQPAKALEHFQMVVKLKPEDAEAQNNLATALANLGKMSEAAEHFQKAVQLKPTYLEGWNNLLMAYDQLHRTDDAIAAARKLVEVAKSQNQYELAKRIEQWLSAQQSTPPSK